MWRQALCSVLSDSSLFIVTTLRGMCGCTPILQLRKLKREDSHVSGPRTQSLEVAEPEVRSRSSGSRGHRNLWIRRDSQARVSVSVYQGTAGR